MIVLDGSMSFYYPPAWLALLFIEAVTVLIECSIISCTSYWWANKDGIIYSRLCLVITMVNLVTAGIGLGWYAWFNGF